MAINRPVVPLAAKHSAGDGLKGQARSDGFPRLPKIAFRCIPHRGCHSPNAADSQSPGGPASTHEQFCEAAAPPQRPRGTTIVMVPSNSTASMCLLAILQPLPARHCFVTLATAFMVDSFDLSFLHSESCNSRQPGGAFRMAGGGTISGSFGEARRCLPACS